MKYYRPWPDLKGGLSFLLLFIPAVAFGQTYKGKVLSGETKSGIGFVNIGIIGKNVGTVADKLGYFSIVLDDIYNNDSVRFSMIGYESKSYLVRYFRENSIKTVYLNPKSYYLT